MDDVNYSFSDIFSASVFEYSPDGCFLARATTNRVVIHNVRDDLIIKAATLPNKINSIHWSADSSFCACTFRYGVYIFAVDQPSWKCKLDLGNEDVGVGLQDFTWCPDARNILTTALDYIQLTVWSISDTSKVTYIQDILPFSDNKSFNSNGEMALAQFDEKFSPCISIYNISDWQRVTTFRVICKDLQHVKWCPDDSSILIRDSMLFNNLYIYSPTGNLLKHYAPEGQLSIGCPLAVWSPTGQFLVSFGHRNVIRVLNSLTYGLLLEEKLEPSLQNNYPNCQMISEVLGTNDIMLNNAYEQQVGSLIIPSTMSKKCKFQCKIKFSWDGKFFAVWTESYSTVVWIFDSTLSVVAILVHLNNVSDFEWHPSEIQLCLCTFTNLIYFWSPDSFFIKRIGTPAGTSPFLCKTVKFNPTLFSISLHDLNDKLIVCDISCP